jgi:hypothetical protein
MCVSLCVSVSVYVCAYLCICVCVSKLGWGEVPAGASRSWCPWVRLGCLYDRAGFLTRQIFSK